jgi:hypothetical protein
MPPSAAWHRTKPTQPGKRQDGYKTRTVQKRWWPLSGQHHQYYSFYLVSGSNGLEQAWGYRIQPFTRQPSSDDPTYLAGHERRVYGPARRCPVDLPGGVHCREQQNVAAFAG